MVLRFAASNYWHIEIREGIGSHKDPEKEIEEFKNICLFDIMANGICIGSVFTDGKKLWIEDTLFGVAIAGYGDHREVSTKPDRA